MLLPDEWTDTQRRPVMQFAVVLKVKSNGFRNVLCNASVAISIVCYTIRYFVVDFALCIPLDYMYEDEYILIER